MTSLPRKDPNLASQVRKSLTDNFKALSPEEIDCTLRDGLTLRQRLQKDKEFNLQKAGSIHFGKHYYEELRQLYSDRTRPEKQLKPKPGLEIQEELMEAATAAMKHPPNRALLVHLLKSLPEVNQAEVVGIFRWLLQLHPAASMNQMESCKAVLDFVVRLDLKSAFPEEVNCMRPKFDEILLQAPCLAFSISNPCQNLLCVGYGLGR